MIKRLQDWVAHQAARRPDATAVTLRTQETPPSRPATLTYGRLEEFSNRLARLLMEAGCRPGDRVCLLMPKSPIAILCMLAVYKAGAILVPLDPASPAGRLSKIIASCGNRWLLAGGPVAHQLGLLLEERRADPPMAIGWMDGGAPPAMERAPAFSLADLDGYPGAPPEEPSARQEVAHILFTSGSTGTPKGVMITHASVIHFVEWAAGYFGMDASDRISGHSPLHFDLSTFDIFGAFAAGGQLHLVPPESNLLPHRLVEFIRDSRLTQWFSVPSVLHYIAKFDGLKPDDCSALKRLVWCGEVFQTPELIYWMTRLPHVRFTNLYGPTEATIASSYYTVPRCPDDGRAAIPIGTACAGEQLLVLDEALQPVPPGVVGELYLRGVGLSPGYWNDSGQTRAAFVPNPHSPDPGDRLYRTGDLASVGEDGLVYFIGRADSQIKSRGHRIELGEIEAALSGVEGLQEYAVVAIPTDQFEGSLICCAYVPLAGICMTALMLREQLNRVIPGYMLPAHWMALDGLPKNANGKIDRRRLKEMFRQYETVAH